MARSSVLSGSRKRSPSLRDREIHRQVKVGCRRQCAVAEGFGLSRGHVSRIVRRVQAWRGAQVEAPGELSDAAQRRVGRWLALARAEERYGLARRLVEEAEGGDRESGVGGQESEGQALRRMSVRLQAVKTALRASRESYELSQSEPPPAPEASEEEKLWIEKTVAALARLRREAEKAGTVPRSPNPRSLVASLLEALIGGYQPIMPRGTYGPGSAHWQVAESLVSGSLDDETLRARYGSQPSAAAAQTAQQRNLDLGAEPGGGTAEDGDASADADKGCGNDSAADRTPTDADVAPQKTEKLRATGAAPPAADGLESTEYSVLSTRSSAAGATHAPLTREERNATEGVRSSEAAPPPGGIEVVGSPEWKIARAKWLKERDQRRIDEAIRRYQEEIEREADLRARRAAAAERRAWLEAGRVRW